MLIRFKPTSGQPDYLVTQNNPTEPMLSGEAASFRFLTYQLSIVRYWPTMALTGNGVLGNDSGETA